MQSDKDNPDKGQGSKRNKEKSKAEVITLRPQEIVCCPRCGACWLAQTEEIYWCDKCAGRFQVE